MNLTTNFQRNWIENSFQIRGCLQFKKNRKEMILYLKLLFSLGKRNRRLNGPNLISWFSKYSLLISTSSRSFNTPQSQHTATKCPLLTAFFPLSFFVLTSFRLGYFSPRRGILMHLSFHRGTA